MTKKESAAIHFASNPTHESYSVTADGRCFINKHSAIVHADTLKDRSVDEISREDVADEIEEALADMQKTEKKVAATKEKDSKKKVVPTREETLEKVYGAKSVEELEELLKDETDAIIIESIELKREELAPKK